MALEGMDVQEAQRVANAIASQPNELARLFSAMTSEIEGVAWVGNDHDAFLRDWSSWSSQVLAQIHAYATEQAGMLQVQIRQQEQASRL